MVSEIFSLAAVVGSSASVAKGGTGSGIFSSAGVVTGSGHFFFSCGFDGFLLGCCWCGCLDRLRLAHCHSRPLCLCPATRRCSDSTPSSLRGGCTLRAYSFASMPFGNSTRKHSMPIAISSSACFAAALLAGFVAVVGDVDSPGAVLLERRP